MTLVPRTFAGGASTPTLAALKRQIFWTTGFNEAAAQRPGKWRVTVNLAAAPPELQHFPGTTTGKNIAAVVQTMPHPQGFNEAPAQRPGKSSHLDQDHAPSRNASMRPRHNDRGNGASETPRDIPGCERIPEGSRNRGLAFPMRAGSAANASGRNPFIHNVK
jgi:hypothetical protein